MMVIGTKGSKKVSNRDDTKFLSREVWIFFLFFDENIDLYTLVTFYM